MRKDVVGEEMEQQMTQRGSKIITTASNLVVPLKIGAQKKIDEVTSGPNTLGCSPSTSRYFELQLSSTNASESRGGARWENLLMLSLLRFGKIRM
mmetsp:Transcript_27248/g.40479  ORF Transcript_27248/g.40479 Transcript_27248/m.40479 type:complete len:95 (-) Transcript_27248:118-402(-)